MSSSGESGKRVGGHFDSSNSVELDERKASASEKKNSTVEKNHQRPNQSRPFPSTLSLGQEASPSLFLSHTDNGDVILAPRKEQNRIGLSKETEQGLLEAAINQHSIEHQKRRKNVRVLPHGLARPVPGPLPRYLARVPARLPVLW